MLSWLCDYYRNFTDSSTVYYMLHLSILNQLLIQLTEMLSGKLYVPKGYHILLNLIEDFTLMLVPQ